MRTTFICCLMAFSTTIFAQDLRKGDLYNFSQAWTLDVEKSDRECSPFLEGAFYENSQRLKLVSGSSTYYFEETDEKVVNGDLYESFNRGNVLEKRRSTRGWLSKVVSSETFELHEDLSLTYTRTSKKFGNESCQYTPAVGAGKKLKKIILRYGNEEILGECEIENDTCEISGMTLGQNERSSYYTTKPVDENGEAINLPESKVTFKLEGKGTLERLTIVGTYFDFDFNTVETYGNEIRIYGKESFLVGEKSRPVIGARNDQEVQYYRYKDIYSRLTIDIVRE